MKTRLFLLPIIVSMYAMYTSATAQPVACKDLSWDASLTYQVNTIESAGLRNTSRFASASLVPVCAIVPIGLYVTGLLTDDDVLRRSYMKSGIETATSIGATYITTIALKHLFDRERPYQAYPNCITGYDNDSDGSWPSGHSAGSAALATSLCLQHPTWYVIAPTVTYAVYMGFSRMHLGMHYITDVLSGYILGSAIAVGVHLLRDELFSATSFLLPGNQSTVGAMQSSTSMINPLRGSYTPLFAITLPL